MCGGNTFRHDHFAVCFVQNCIFMNKYLTFVNISRGFFLDSISCRIEGYLHPSGLLLSIISH